MFANSPICDGELNGYRSFREHIWTDTDRNRSGLLKFAFAPEVSFAHYVEYALDVPMYFIVRNKNYINMTAVTFRQFLTSGYNGERATIEDWNDHLTTLFPETRIKRYLEIRSVDSQPPDLMPALSALIKGAFYDNDCLQAAWDLVKDWSWDERMQVYLDSHRDALAAGCTTGDALDDRAAASAAPLPARRGHAWVACRAARFPAANVDPGCLQR